MNFIVLLISTYEMGRQPFGLTSPAAWLREAGLKVHCVDLAVEQLSETAITEANLVAFYVPMHMATRLTVPVIERVQQVNPQAHLCCFGLYAPVNETYLRHLGIHTILGGEFETGLVTLAKQLLTQSGSGQPPVQSLPLISVARQEFHLPDRSDLPQLTEYAHLVVEEGLERVVGYTEASRGCKHLCRHCPIVPVYGGRFRIVQREVVLADIRQQVKAGAQHITFGDPDFFNGPGHALPLVQTLHQEFPDLTYDVTIKVEHLLKYAHHLETLKQTGCLFITTAVESFAETILTIFDKRHTLADFEATLAHARQLDLLLIPTFVAFTPWTTLAGYYKFLHEITRLGLVEQVAPIQYTLRLLIPPGSRLLELPEVQHRIGPLVEARLSYPWQNPDPRVDHLQQDLERLVQHCTQQNLSRRAIFEKIWARVQQEMNGHPIPVPTWPTPPQFVPYLSEPWYC